MTASFSGAALLRVAVVASLGALTVWPAASAAEVLAYRNLRLPNGLNVVVHEDHSAPIVSLAVWYRVGSADEPAGRTGFAHLFEHLMFRGSKHYNAPFLDAMNDMGGGNVNADTSFDHTAYYATVPTAALDRALWLESDRMGHLLGPLDHTRLTTERAVVRNEHRDNLDLPYARAYPHLLRHLFPANHPYHHDVDGHAADLDNLTVEDARSWFRSHYGAANATLVMAGDITPEAAREKAMTYFGDLAPGPDLVRQQPWVVPLRVAARGTMHDHVAKHRIVRAWPIPQAGTDAAARLRLAARILGDGAASRLHARLVSQDRVATDVAAYVPSLALAGMLWLIVDVAEGADPAAVESALDEELRRFLASGPDRDEIALAQVQENTDFLAATERMDAKARRLALGQALHDDPGEEWVAQLRMAHADAESVRREAAAWLSQPSYTLSVLPAPEGFDAEAEDASDTGLGIAEGQPAPGARRPAPFAPCTGGRSTARSRRPSSKVPRNSRSQPCTGVDSAVGPHSCPRSVPVRRSCASASSLAEAAPAISGGCPAPRCSPCRCSTVPPRCRQIVWVPRSKPVARSTHAWSACACLATGCKPASRSWSMPSVTMSARTTSITCERSDWRQPIRAR